MGRCTYNGFGLLALSLIASGPAGASFYPYKTIPVGSAATVVAIGDLNGDGRADVAVATGSSGDPVNDRSVFIFIQSEDGTLAPPVRYSTGLDARGIAIGDLNGDGRVDLAVCGGNGVAVLRQKPDGTLAPADFTPTGDGADGVAIGDLNDDGRADLAVSHNGEPQISVLYQSVSGALLPPQRYGIPDAGLNQLAIGDVTGDGLPDLLLLRGTPGRANVAVFSQDPITHSLRGPFRYGWGFTRSAHGFALIGLAGSARTDVAVTWGGAQPDCGLSIFPQGTDGMLHASTTVDASDGPEAVVAADMNGDGLTDLIVAHGGWQSLGTYLQQPDGTLAPETLDPLPFTSRYAPQGLAVGDLNGDGRPDIALADPDNGLVLLYNAGSADLNPPSTTILRKPPTFSQSTNVAFQYQGQDDMTPAASLQFSWNLDSGAWTAFSSDTTATLTDLFEGWHTFSVAARDAAGNVDPSPPSYRFLVDYTAPSELTLRGVGAFTAAQSVIVSATASDNTASPRELTYSWRVDGSPWSVFSPADKLTLYGLFEGAHTVETRASDPAGNVTPISASLSFVVDRTPPRTRIVSVTRNPASGATTVVVAATDNIPPPNRLSFSWRLDEGTWSAFSASTRIFLPPVSTGPHTLQVRARDSAGNIEPTPASQGL